MKPEVAFDLGIVVKNIKVYTALQQYAEERIEFHRKEMEMTSKPDEWMRAQGAIKELRRMLKLYEEVESTVREFKEKV